MTLVAVDNTLEVIAKIDATDHEAAVELLRFGLYETLVELVGQARPQLERDVAAAISKRNVELRRVLVREFINKRASGEEPRGFLEAAAHVTLTDELISKEGELPSGATTPDNPDTDYWDARDRKGRFASLVDAVHALAGSSPHQVKNERATAAVNQALSQNKYTAARNVGAALRNTSLPGAQPLGVAAQVYGEMDEEARDILHRGIKRTAYRYRGTEKTPDKTLVANINAANKILDRLDPKAGPDEKMAALREMLEGEVRPERPGGGLPRRGGEASPGSLPSSAITRFWLSQGQRQDLSPDQLDLRTRGDIVANYLRKQVPNMTLTNLSNHAGAIPPSKGVIIDADGDVVVEAMGYKGDHYLPFDLKNIKRLSGGQYVRTRSAGGPTSEDIYTALLSNARQLQVVSNSGVFTLELDPDLRGGRRYSDKVGQMIDRYRQLLKTINTVSNDPDELKRMYARDIDPEDKRAARQYALENAGGNKALADEIYSDELRKRRLQATYVTEDEDSLEAEAEEAARNWQETQTRLGRTVSSQQVAREKQDRFNELVNEQNANQVRAYKLDGEGYATALEALRQEFPYYIRDTHYETLPDFVRRRGLNNPAEPLPRRGLGITDPGYTKPNRLDPHDLGSLREQRATAASTISTPSEDGGRAPARTTAASTPAGETMFVRLPPDRDVKPLESLIPSADSPEARKAGAAIRDVTAYARQGFDVLDIRFQNGEADTQDALANATDPASWLQWVWAKHADGSSPKLMNWLMTEAPPEVVARQIKAIAELRDMEAVGNKPDNEVFTSGITMLRSRQPFAGPGTHKDFAKRPNEQVPLPLRFPEITTQLGDDPSRYELYRQKARTDRAGLADAIDEIEEEPEPQDMINLAIDRYERAARWGGSGAQPNNVDPDITPEMAQQAARGRGPLVDRALNLQLAWSWKVGRDLSQALGGGVRRPKDPELPQPEQMNKGRRHIVFLAPMSQQAVELRKRLLSQ